MAKTKESTKIADADMVTELTPAADAPRPKLKKLEISNFRAIGSKPVSLDCLRGLRTYADFNGDLVCTSYGTTN